MQYSEMFVAAVAIDFAVLMTQPKNFFVDKTSIVPWYMVGPLAAIALSTVF